MAHVRPFRGVRYASGVALDPVLAPPYDVISAAQREALARDARNVVHLELPVDENGPGTRYEAAAKRLARWRAEGLLASDPEPAVYPYIQRFEHAGRSFERRGVFALVELVPPGAAGNIYPHEFTLSGPREDRQRLLAATRANLSPIFLLYEGGDGEVAAALEGAWDAPVARARTPWGTTESLARVTGAAAERAARALGSRPLIFADGHHRYESALRYAEESGARGDDPRRYLLAVFVDRADPGLLVLPTHRVVQPAAMREGAEWERLLGSAFESVSLGSGTAAVPAAERWLESPAAAGRPAFVMARGQEPRLTGLVLRPGGAEALFGTDSAVAPALRELDVIALHALLERGLGLTPEAVRDRGALTYTRDAGEAAAAAAGGSGAAFLVRPTPVERVIALAAAGHRLPQKSTYFEPKLTSGWLFHTHDPEAAPAGTSARSGALTEEKR